MCLRSSRCTGNDGPWSPESSPWHQVPALMRLPSWDPDDAGLSSSPQRPPPEPRPHAEGFEHIAIMEAPWAPRRASPVHSAYAPFGSPCMQPEGRAWGSPVRGLEGNSPPDVQPAVGMDWEPGGWDEPMPASRQSPSLSELPPGLSLQVRHDPEHHACFVSVERAYWSCIREGHCQAIQSQPMCQHIMAYVCYLVFNSHCIALSKRKHQQYLLQVALWT